MKPQADHNALISHRNAIRIAIHHATVSVTERVDGIYRDLLDVNAKLKSLPKVKREQEEGIAKQKEESKSFENTDLPKVITVKNIANRIFKNQIEELKDFEAEKLYLLNRFEALTELMPDFHVVHFRAAFADSYENALRQGLGLSPIPAENTEYSEEIDRAVFELADTGDVYEPHYAVVALDEDRNQVTALMPCFDRIGQLLAAKLGDAVIEMIYPFGMPWEDLKPFVPDLS